MAHRTFKEIGQQLAGGWGFDDGGDINAKIKLLAEAKETVCLLAAVVSAINDTNKELRDLRYTVSKQSKVPPAPSPAIAVKERDIVADAMLKWMQTASRVKTVEGMDWSNLSTRATKALQLSGVTELSQITPERLYDVRNCGVGTINEIMEWVEAQR